VVGAWIFSGTTQWVKVSISFNFIIFFMVQDDPSCSDPDWRSKLTRFDFCTRLCPRGRRLSFQMTVVLARNFKATL